MSLLTTIGHGVGSMCRWLFVTKCTTAAPLLSLSFAINSIYTGISLSRFNLANLANQKAAKCIDSIANDKFLAKIEKLGKENKDVLKELYEFCEKIGRYTDSLNVKLSAWEVVNRLVAICCAATAFVWMAFEPETRISMLLVLPYLLILLIYLIRVWCRYIIIKSGYQKLLQSMERAAKDEDDEFDPAIIKNKFKAIRENLAGYDNAEKESGT